MKEIVKLNNYFINSSLIQAGSPMSAEVQRMILSNDDIPWTFGFRKDLTKESISRILAFNNKNSIIIALAENSSIDKETQEKILQKAKSKELSESNSISLLHSLSKNRNLDEEIQLLLLNENAKMSDSIILESLAYNENTTEKVQKILFKIGNESVHESLSLRSDLSSEMQFLIAKNGSEIPVKNLLNKNDSLDPRIITYLRENRPEIFKKAISLI